MSINYAFIDGQNVHQSIKSLGWNVDWKRFRVYLTEHYGASEAFLFIGYIEENNKLYTMLQQAGFICVFKPILKYKSGTIKGNVDAEMVLHTMIQFSNFDKAIIISGDGDFACLIQYLFEQGKLQTILVPNRNRYSALIKRFAKKKIAFMNDLQNKIGVKRNRTSDFQQVA